MLQFIQIVYIIFTKYTNKQTGETTFIYLYVRVIYV
jgi:hypothetical protein